MYQQNRQQLERKWKAENNPHFVNGGPFLILYGKFFVRFVLSRAITDSSRVRWHSKQSMPNCSAATPGSASQRHCCFSYCSVKYVCGAPLAWAPSPDSCSSETGLELIDGKGRRQSAALVTIKINGRGWSIAFSRKLTAWRLCLSFGEFRVICQIKIYIVGEVRLTWKKCQEKEDKTGQKGPLSAVLFKEEQNKKYQSHAITKSRPLVFCHVSACQKTSEQAPCSQMRKIYSKRSSNPYCC